MEDETKAVHFLLNISVPFGDYVSTLTSKSSNFVKRIISRACLLHLMAQL